jgi:ribosomal subunit interface protein
MPLIISGRGMVLTTAFKAVVERKVGRLERLASPPLEVRVTCGAERFQRTARMVARTRQRSFSSAASADRLLPAVEGALDALCRQMREARTRRRRVRSRGPATDAPGAGA